MKKTIITLLAIAVVAVGGYMAGSKKNAQQLKAQTELLQLIHDDDPNTWCDVICETDEYLNCFELDCIDF